MNPRQRIDFNNWVNDHWIQEEDRKPVYQNNEKLGYRKNQDLEFKYFSLFYFFRENIALESKSEEEEVFNTSQYEMPLNTSKSKTRYLTQKAELYPETSEYADSSRGIYFIFILIS